MILTEVTKFAVEGIDAEAPPHSNSCDIYLRVTAKRHSSLFVFALISLLTLLEQFQVFISLDIFAAAGLQ